MTDQSFNNTVLCREVFELKAAEYYRLIRREDGHYLDLPTDAAWKGWQSCWRHFETILDKWQPIATAPKNGTTFLCAMIATAINDNPIKSDIILAWYDEGSFRDVDYDPLDKNKNWEPIHWMPLPKPPKGDTAAYALHHSSGSSTASHVTTLISSPFVGPPRSESI